MSQSSNRKVEKQLYYINASFKFSLHDFPDEFDFSLVKKFGWFRPKNWSRPNLNGISRDHIYSISEGFKNNIDPLIIAHPANCKLVRHDYNFKKNSRCDISIEELLEKIERWEEKYK